MPVVVVRQKVQASAAVLWDVLTNIAAAPTVRSRVAAVDIPDGAEFRAGLAWQEARHDSDGGHIVTHRVTEVDEYHSATVLSETAELALSTRYTLDEEAGHTILTVHTDYHPQPGAMIAQVAAQLRAPWTKKHLREHLECDVADAARAAEDRQL